MRPLLVLIVSFCFSPAIVNSAPTTQQTTPNPTKETTTPKSPKSTTPDAPKSTTPDAPKSTTPEAPKATTPEGSSNTIWIILGVVGGLILIGCVIFGIVYFIRRRRRKQADKKVAETAPPPPPKAEGGDSTAREEAAAAAEPPAKDNTSGEVTAQSTDEKTDEATAKEEVSKAKHAGHTPSQKTMPQGTVTRERDDAPTMTVDKDTVYKVATEESIEHK